MKQRGYFSLIQYVPHLGRAEAANVGVVVIAEGQPPAVLLAESNDGPKRRFGAEQVSERHLEAAKRALRAQLESYLGSSSSRDALTAFARSAGNALQLTPPRAYAVEDVSAAARQLLDELVEVTPVHRSRR